MEEGSSRMIEKLTNSFISALQLMGLIILAGIFCITMAIIFVAMYQSEFAAAFECLIVAFLSLWAVVFMSERS